MFRWRLWNIVNFYIRVLSINSNVVLISIQIIYGQFL